MFFFNLTLPEFLAIFTAASGLVVALYLLSRSRRKQTVASLRFWTAARSPVPSTRRRRIQQPWSLILQLLSLLLLLLAIAQLRIGDREHPSRDHVLLLDASSWMSARSGDKTLLDEARERAHAYVRRLPSTDRVMVVRVDGLPSPATAMDLDRTATGHAIDDTRPGASALNLDQAFLFAEQIRALHGSTGEIVYIGPGRVAAGGEPVNQPSNLRLIDIKGPSGNVGLARISVRRSESDSEAWDVFVAVRNYDSTGRRVPVTMSFGGAPFGSTLIDAGPNGAGHHTFQLRTKAAGWVEARLPVRDALEEDNRAILEIPERKSLKVAVYTTDPQAIRPALAAHPQVQAAVYPPALYKPDVDAQIVIFDRFSPSQPPDAASVWLEPPEGSPFRTRSRVGEASAVQWRTDHPIGAGIRTRDLRLTGGQVLAAEESDIAFASVPAGPVAIARPQSKAVALGFHPGRSELRYDLATPLLMANILRWLEPEVFRTSEVLGGSVGTVSTALDVASDRRNIRVLADGEELPWTVQGDTLRFFAGGPGIVRVLDGDREQVHSLSLPEVGEKFWAPASSVRRGMPGLTEQAMSRDLWQILATLGAIGLIVEWILFGRKREPSFQRQQASAHAAGPDDVLRRAS